MTFNSSAGPQTGPSGHSTVDFPLRTAAIDSVPESLRDTVQALEENPAVVSISDIHGYLDAARSALLTLRDCSGYDPVVVQDDQGRLHWANNGYVLVFNGDLIDRGPANVEALQMVTRLLEEAPPGHVRVTIGNHEMGVVTPALFRWDSWFSGQVGSAGRRALFNAILDGHVVAAYEGYNVTYAHAGHANEYDVTAVNETLTDVARRLRDVINEETDAQTQRAIVDENPLVLGMGEGHPKGPDGGLVWVDFQHLPADAPPQVVGHTRHDSVTQKGSVVCQNVIRNTVDSAGGEAILVETTDSLTALCRESDGSVSRCSLGR